MNPIEIFLDVLRHQTRFLDYCESMDQYYLDQPIGKIRNPTGRKRKSRGWTRQDIRRQKNREEGVTQYIGDLPVTTSMPYGNPSTRVTTAFKRFAFASRCVQAGDAAIQFSRSCTAYSGAELAINELTRVHLELLGFTRSDMVSELMEASDEWEKHFGFLETLVKIKAFSEQPLNEIDEIARKLNGIGSARFKFLVSKPRGVSFSDFQLAKNPVDNKLLTTSENPDSIKAMLSRLSSELSKHGYEISVSIEKNLILCRRIQAQ